MARWVLVLLAMGALHAQDAASPSVAAAGSNDLKTERPAPPPDNGQYATPPEEDKSVTVDNYSFNPLQSKKDVMVGDEYFKQGNYKAAAGRFRDATKWNAQNADAWRRLGDAAEKTKDAATVKEAYNQFLKLAPESKEATDIRKKLAKLK